ncbi:depolymerase [Undibacterium sp. YM2]|uniref:extracellular catalytic domain type 1 short-chain-length polyhydroxyalkanoate depolymerase n=1 Tax=Undibacterium sp. YM2 TaxID=2058625 RepID=UPI001331F740|nr:PHB depolymerase family esterase [Undibacterium sp. YM2]BBB67709.1 depolymerase [Undibacterium sp. YM2]
MSKRISKSLWSRSFKRILSTMTKVASRTGARAIKKTLAAVAPKAAKRKSAKPGASTKPASVVKRKLAPDMVVGVVGLRPYYLYRPPAVKPGERLPLMVMLHGCLQDAQALAASSKMNQLAARKRFLVLYPEQEKFSNPQACWNWYDTRSGRAQREADSIDAVIDQVCLSQPIDTRRIALAGLSAGASMAALLTVSHPARFGALVMHSGIATGLAHSSATAVMAMRGRRLAAIPLPAGVSLPALLVIQGSKDRVVFPVNGSLVAQQWAKHAGAKAVSPRTVQRGARYPSTITDYRTKGRVLVSLCEVNGLDHAWSGGAKGYAYSDPKGPDATAMIWAFVSKQFAGVS